MKATEANFLKFLQGTKQFIIPIYQRTYSWTGEQCQQLWDDISRAAVDSSISGHFIGSIVYIERGLYQISSVSQLLVIDGQQRLTTLSLLLAAMRDAVEEQGPERTELTARRLENYYLFNAEESGELHHKLVLTQSDRTTLTRILERKSQGGDLSRRVVDTYGFFKRAIASSGIDLDVLFTGLQKLIVVDIALNREHDNPQLIFESLNSTGLELSQADLIRNYVLMDLEPAEQEALYNDAWYPMEQAFGQADYAAHFDRFMRDYLTIRTGRIPRLAEVYSDFKAYARSSKRSIAALVEDVHRYAQHYARIALEQESDKALRSAFHDINTLKVDVAFPFLLEVYDDYVRNALTRDELLRIVRLVEAYVIRRAMCGIATNSLNKTFQTFSKGIDKQQYLASVEARFQNLDSYRRFPNDDEFRKEFVVRDIYNLTNRRNYLLRKLENFTSKEAVNVEAYTIEHIMPQSDLSKSWQDALGPDWKRVQDTYLHTIGNLTLTGYNSELSNRPFLEKRDMAGGFRDSPNSLNRDLASLERWDEAAIKQRAARLAERAVQIWTAPRLSEQELAALSLNNGVSGLRTYTIADHEHLVGQMQDLWVELRKRILNLDPSVTEEILKVYIAYKAASNFVDVEPQKSSLVLVLNLEFDEISDPLSWCRDVAEVGRHGNGEVQFRISSYSQLDYAMDLIRQSFAKQVMEDAFTFSDQPRI